MLSNCLNKNNNLSFLIVFFTSSIRPDIVPFNPSLAIIIVPLILFVVRNFCKKSLFFFKDLILINL